VKPAAWLSEESSGVDAANLAIIPPMPIFEYSCRACGHQFEFLKLPTTPDAARCPACQGEDLERLLSGFAMSTRELTNARAKAARKQQLGSKEHKDKVVAITEEREHHH
jgi:putative FmdB family regulatory protein